MVLFASNSCNSYDTDPTEEKKNNGIVITPKIPYKLNANTYLRKCELQQQVSSESGGSLSERILL